MRRSMRRDVIRSYRLIMLPPFPMQQHRACRLAGAQSSSACTDLVGDPVPPKLFLAPAKEGGAPPRDDDSVDGAVAPSASPPSRLAGGWRMGAPAKQGQREGCLPYKCTM
jgi:hypothetical protein